MLRAHRSYSDYSTMRLTLHLVLTLEAWIFLVLYDLIGLLGVSRSYRLVRRCPVVGAAHNAARTAQICRAVDEACVWYVHRVFCLQRSAVTTALLRLHGIAADLVIGYRPVPVESHAWVEVARTVVNDRPQYQQRFLELDRL